VFKKYILHIACNKIELDGEARKQFRKEPAESHFGSLSPMIDHFSFLASLYDRLISPPDPSRYRELLNLPVEG